MVLKHHVHRYNYKHPLLCGQWVHVHEFDPDEQHEHDYLDAGEQFWAEATAGLQIPAYGRFKRANGQPLEPGVDY